MKLNVFGIAYTCIYGVGVAEPISSIPSFFQFFNIVKTMFSYMIWQLGCGDTRQLWKWFIENNKYVCKITYLLAEKFEPSFSNP